MALPFEQGGLDSLCGIYGLVNAERMINNTTIEESQQLFKAIVEYLNGQDLLAPILTEGMLLKHAKAILTDVIGDRIPYRRLPFAGVQNPDLDAFWTEVESFLNTSRRRAILLSISGAYDHYTVVERITQKQMQLLDSGRLHHLNRISCTTAGPRGERQHVLLPAQTYFLGSE